MRTIEDFVTEQICKDRTKEQVRSVALSTRWEPVTDLVLKTYDNLCSPLDVVDVVCEVA